MPTSILTNLNLCDLTFIKKCSIIVIGFICSERNETNMRKKLISILMISAMLMSSAAVTANAEEEGWRSAFVTRLMKQLSTDPAHNEVALTDLDKNGIPEAFVYRNSNDGGISAGFTMSGNSVKSIEVPGNIIGACLADIEVYIKNGNYIFAGKEVPRYSSVINYYKLVLSDYKLEAIKINKHDVSPYQSVQYVDMASSNFLTDGYPNRTKIQDFINSYEAVNTLTASPSTAKLSINGTQYELAGFNVNNANYYKIRDIAMLMSTTTSRFNVVWDPELNGISILTNQKYTIIGGELENQSYNTLDISETSAPIFVNGFEKDMQAYTINGNTYFKIRDIADVAQFTVDWDSATETIVIRSK